MDDPRERIREAARKRLLGWGVATEEVAAGFDLARDVVLTAGPSGLDLQRIDGIDNLGQDLTIALTTGLGTDPFNVGFGFDGINALVEETNPIMVRERVRLSVMATLRRDPRVRRIIDVKLGGDRLDPARRSDGSDGRARRELGVTVRFETISGDELSLGLGKVVSDG